MAGARTDGTNSTRYSLLPPNADLLIEKSLDHQDSIRAAKDVAIDAWAAERDVLRSRNHLVAVQVERRINVMERLEERASAALRNGVELLRVQMRDTPSTFRPDGRQTFTFATKDIYDGEWKNTIMHGHGKLTTADGQVYEGEWFLGVQSGSGAFRCAKSETTYVGRWYEGRRHGKGELVEPEGTYRGEFRDGRLHGNGEYAYLDGHKYRGEWLNDHYHGSGTYNMPSGAYYEGEWVRGAQNGRGLAVGIDGLLTDAYIGEWRDGKRHGRGTLKCSAFTYVGQWEFDVMQGQGTLTYANGSVYDGAVQRSAPHGHGTFTAQNGVTYTGEWRDGKRHGLGEYRSADRRLCYNGAWVRDLKEGRGVLTNNVVGRIEGFWHDDVLHGPAVFFPMHGEKVDLRFECGVCTAKSSGAVNLISNIDSSLGIASLGVG